MARPEPDAAALFGAETDRRATELERQRALDQLRLHVGTARLGLDEFEQRFDEALAAESVAELVHALRDLPRLRTQAELRAMRQHVVLPYLMVSGMLVVIWAVCGFGFPWPIFPLAGWGLPVLDRWRELRRQEPPPLTSHIP